MNAWLDFTLVGIAVLASIGYAIYALGPRRIKNAYSRLATKYLGLHAAKWFAPSANDPRANDSCSNCSSRDRHLPQR